MEARSSSSSSLLETTIFFLSRLILRILKSKVLSKNSSRFLMRLLSICEPGRKASMPMSTIKPPLTLRITLPETIEPSLQWLIRYSHWRWRMAFSCERTIWPSLSSVFSKKTSTSPPMLSSSGLGNSDIETSPSDFKPTSTTIKSLLISTILPFKI